MKQAENDTLHNELRQLFLSTCEGLSDDNKIHILSNLALMELDTWCNTELALADITEAVTLAGNDKTKVRRQIPLWFRILFNCINRLFAKVIIAVIMILCVLFLVYLETMLVE